MSNPFRYFNSSPEVIRLVVDDVRALSLAFLAPDIAKALVEGRLSRGFGLKRLVDLRPALVSAEIDGRLPRGFGVKRLMDLPMAWPDQWSALGLA
jgi:hypothetical protein